MFPPPRSTRLSIKNWGVLLATTYKPVAIKVENIIPTPIIQYIKIPTMTPNQINFLEPSKWRSSPLLITSVNEFKRSMTSASVGHIPITWSIKRTDFLICFIFVGFLNSSSSVFSITVQVANASSISFHASVISSSVIFSGIPAARRLFNIPSTVKTSL